MLDRRHPPTPRPTTPTASVYVDNLTVNGVFESSVVEVIALVSRRLESVGIVPHERTAPSTDFSVVGVRYDRRRRILQHEPRRAWRLYLAARRLE